MAYQAPAQYLFSPSHSRPQIATAMDEFNAQWLSNHQLPDQSKLFHYTTYSGMRGIISERAIRCGHASSFNDPIEIQYGRDLILDFLNARMISEEREEIRTFLSSLLGQVSWFDKIQFDPFIACFCESGSLLSQWRSYADPGGGFSLGFVFTESSRIISPHESKNKGRIPILRKVIYDRSEQSNLIRSFYELLLPAVASSISEGSQSGKLEPPHLMSLMAAQAVNLLWDLMLTFKHNAFAEEREWRLIRATRDDYDPEGIQFHERRGVDIPYRLTNIYNETESGNGAFPLRSIYYGPTHDPEQTNAIVRLLLRTISADQHEIKIDPGPVSIESAGYRIRH